MLKYFHLIALVLFATFNLFCAEKLVPKTTITQIKNSDNYISYSCKRETTYNNKLVIFETSASKTKCYNYRTQEPFWLYEVTGYENLKNTKSKHEEFAINTFKLYEIDFENFLPHVIKSDTNSVTKSNYLSK